MTIVTSLHPGCRWTPEKGMSAITGWCILRSLGVKIKPYQILETRTTLANFLNKVCVTKTYLVVLKDHVLTIKKGLVYDKGCTEATEIIEGFFEISA